MKSSKKDLNLKLQYKKYEQLLDKELKLQKSLYKFQEERILTNYLIHDLATPLSSAQAAFLILESDKNTYGSNLVLESGKTSVDSAVKLLESIQNLKQEKGRKSIFNLQDATKHVIRMLNSKAKKFDIQINFTSDYEVYLNSYQVIFQRVLLNLINNSIEELQSIKKDSKLIIVNISYKDEKSIISIKDNGRGIPPTLQKKIFTTKFSTKQNHSGLGLSYVKDSVIKDLRGILDIKSEPFEGTEVFLKLQGFCKKYDS